MPLSMFGKFLEEIGKMGEEVSSAIPNTGFVNESLILATSFQGAKGFGVITRKRQNRKENRSALVPKVKKGDMNAR